jgi:hypothetical protein
MRPDQRREHVVIRPLPEIDHSVTVALSFHELKHLAQLSDGACGLTFDNHLFP